MSRSRVLHDLLIGGALCLLSLIAGAGALASAEFGAPAWVLLVLLAWLLTIGLPTLAAVLLLAGFWPGPSFAAFLLSAVFLALLAQFGAVHAVRRVTTARWMSGR